MKGFAVSHSRVDLKIEVYYLNRQKKSSLLKMANPSKRVTPDHLSPPARSLHRNRHDLPASGSLGRGGAHFDSPSQTR
jgi:hypothetical protein